MTDLQFWTILAAIWLSISWLPYILDRIFVRGLIGALQNFDPSATPQSEWAQRAMRAHRVAVEAFVAFAPLAILTMILRPEDELAGTLALTFFFGIVVHYLIYCAGIIVLRTGAFAVAAFSTLGLGLRLLGVI